MLIKIHDIPPDGLSFDLDEQMDLIDRGIPDPVGVSGELTIRPEDGGRFQIRGHVKASLTLECDRCLEPYSFPVDTDVYVELAPIGAIAAQHGEHELSRGELELEFFEGSDIEPLEYVKEQLLIAIPMVHLHDAACKGLCSVCGANLNTTQCGHHSEVSEAFSPFSSLKDLLNT